MRTITAANNTVFNQYHRCMLLQTTNIVSVLLRYFVSSIDKKVILYYKKHIPCLYNKKKLLATF